MPTGIDGEFAVCDEANTVRIDGNEITFDYVAAGERWVLEILDSYLINDTIVLNARPTYPYQEWTFDWKFVWLDRERGIAEWILEPTVDTFVTDENLSKFPKVDCFYNIEDGTTRLAKSKNPEDLVSSTDSIFEKIAGDLNNDGEDDCVIITKQTRKSAFVTHESYGELDRNRRGLVIAFKEGEEYNTVLAVPDCFSSENEDGGAYIAPDLYITIKRGNLLIHYGHGRYGEWHYTFRYRNSDFELIGYDESNSNGPVIDSSVSINFLTKKKQKLVNTDPDADSGYEVFEETWKDIDLTNGIVKLTDIDDFDNFPLDWCYIER
ncbi:hypothetical protein AGMMS49965_25950 [Bacteroidia bacterium]|nr:hypothetical protein AGMMS49965_25950 [Bacteroidia bacterium]